MARTPSTMLALGTKAVLFSLPDTNGKIVSLSDFDSDPALLVMFICNHCPYVKHVRAELARIGRDYQKRGLGIVAISSNDAEQYPDDSQEAMRIEKETAGYTFPYLYDESQEVARTY